MEVFVEHGDYSNIVHLHVLLAYKQLGDDGELGDYGVGDYYALDERDYVDDAVDEMFDVNG